jgi:hypothetical protein
VAAGAAVKEEQYIMSKLSGVATEAAAAATEEEAAAAAAAAVAATQAEEAEAEGKCRSQRRRHGRGIR